MFSRAGMIESSLSFPARPQPHRPAFVDTAMNTSPTSGGMRAFVTIWLGQLVSLVGSQLTGFALGVWVYDETRSVLLLALAQLAFPAPFVFLSPLAGVL